MKKALLIREKGSEDMYEVVSFDELDKKERPEFGSDLRRYVWDNYDLGEMQVVYVEYYEHAVERVEEVDSFTHWIVIFNIEWSFNIEITEDGEMNTVVGLDEMVTCQNLKLKSYIWIRWQGGDWMRLEKPYKMSEDLPMSLCGDVLVEEGYDVLVISSLAEPPSNEFEDGEDE